MLFDVMPSDIWPESIVGGRVHASVGSLAVLAARFSPASLLILGVFFNRQRSNAERIHH